MEPCSENKKTKLRNKIILISISAVLSVSLFVFSVILVKNMAIQTGFSSFFSLIFSDFNVISQNWKNFAISLLETLPITNVILSLLIGGIAFFCVKLSIRAIKIFNIYKQNHNYKLIN